MAARYLEAPGEGGVAMTKRSQFDGAWATSVWLRIVGLVVVVGGVVVAALVASDSTVGRHRWYIVAAIMVGAFTWGALLAAVGHIVAILVFIVNNEQTAALRRPSSSG
jgi:hypothetical protein